MAALSRPYDINLARIAFNKERDVFIEKTLAAPLYGHIGGVDDYRLWVSHPYGTSSHAAHFPSGIYRACAVCCWRCPGAVLLRRNRIGQVLISITERIKPINMPEETMYEIRVREILDEKWSAHFFPFIVTNGGNDTLLSGVVHDQAELFGVLLKIRDHGLVLVSLNRAPSSLNNGIFNLTG